MLIVSLDALLPNKEENKPFFIHKILFVLFTCQFSAYNVSSLSPTVVMANKEAPYEGVIKLL